MKDWGISPAMRSVFYPAKSRCMILQTQKTTHGGMRGFSITGYKMPSELGEAINTDAVDGDFRATVSSGDASQLQQLYAYAQR